MSSTLQPIVLSDIRCGDGYLPLFTPRHHVADDTGMIAWTPLRGRFGPLPLALFRSACSGVTVGSPMIWDCLRYPSPGSLAKVEPVVVSMKFRPM